MPATNRQQQTSESRFWDAAALQAWKQCLTENGLKGAIGCAHLATDAADALLAERRKRNERNGK